MDTPHDAGRAEALGLAYLSGSGAAPDPAKARQLGTTVVTLVTQLRERWPRLSLPDERFAQLLGRHSPAGNPGGGLEVEDLYLAGACAAGDAAAQQELDARLRQLVKIVRRIDATETFGDEVMQLTRLRLLAAEEGKARLEDYSGRGSLNSWLRSVLMRTALNLRAARKPSDPIDGFSEHELPVANSDPELRLLRARYAGAFNEALRGALSLLGQRERAVLRMQLVDRMTVGEIAATYQVNRSTVTRWLTSARAGLVDATRATLLRQLSASPSEVESIIKACRSIADVSLPRQLEESEP